MKVGPPEGFRQLCEAFHLVYEEYVKCGYVGPNPTRMRYGVREILPSSATFVATFGGAVVGTGTVVAASPAGLPSSDVFGDVFEDLATRGRRVAEATMLACVDVEGIEAHSLSLQLVPWGIAWALGQRADDWCVVVNPKHLRFWHKTLGLEILGESRPCDHVSGHPGLLLRLPLREIRKGCFEFTPALKSRVLDRLPAEHAARRLDLRVEEIAVLLVRQPQLLQGLTDEQRHLLDRLYPEALRLAELSSFRAPGGGFAEAA